MKKPLSFLSNYQQHNYFLLGSTVVILLLVYSVSIRKTKEYQQRYYYNLNSVQKAATATLDIERYQKRLSDLRQTALKAYDREQLLSSITSFCKGKELLVRTFPQEKIISEKDYNIITNTLEVEGDYKAIVELIYHIEQTEKIAAVSSSNFFMHKDYNSRREQLRCAIVLRNLEG